MGGCYAATLLSNDFLLNFNKVVFFQKRASVVCGNKLKCVHYVHLHIKQKDVFSYQVYATKIIF